MQPTQIYRNTSQNGARAKIMRALYTEGLLPIPEICEICGLTAKQSRDNLGAAKNDGLVVSERDDVTSRLAFKLTADGKKWVTDRGLHLKNSKASQEEDAADAQEAAVEIADVIEDTREAVVDEAPSGAETAGVENATADVPDAITTIYGTVNEVGEFGLHPTLKEAINLAKDRAEATGLDVPVYRMILVGKTRTTVDFVAEDATA
jgi:hypothetical protein